MTNSTPRTLTATIGKDSREIEVHDCWNDGRRLDSDRAVGLFQKKPGGKVWPQTLTFWREADGSYRLATTTTILNRDGYRLIGFSADARPSMLSAHNSARGAA